LFNTPISQNMIPSVNFRGFIGCITMLFFCSLSAQESKGNENNIRAEKYQQLLKLGYQEKEIFEDLGNANFLVEKYEEAIFWYTKLIDINSSSAVKASYYERYLFALKKIRATSSESASDDRDWLAHVKEDYDVKNTPVEPADPPEKLSKFKDFNFQQEQVTTQELTWEDLGLEIESTPYVKDKDKFKFAYNAPITITEDGGTCYFSRAVFTKPVYGVFSKKELVYRIYKANKIKGKWQNIKEVALAPNHYNAIHPTVSPDGKRLFFASNMPGTFGKYDIYVSDIQSNGTFGVAKNLGQKVNTDDNDLYPRIIGGSSLAFASEGRQGFGGLDVFMVQVNHKKVGTSVNLGTEINSIEDDYSILLTGENGMGYVMSNRGENKSNPQRVAFTYSKEKRDKLLKKRQFNILEGIDDHSEINYSNTVFEE